MDVANSTIFFAQAEKICREVFERLSGNLFESIEIKQFESSYFGVDEADFTKEQSAFFSIIARDSVAEEMQAQNRNVVISNSFFDDNKINFFVITYKNRDEKKYLKYQKFFESLFSILFDFLKEKWCEGTVYFYNGSISTIIVRRAVDDLVTEISKRCCKYNDVSLYENINLSLLNVISDLSYQTYEKGETQGMIYFTNDKSNADYLFEFQNYEDYGFFLQDNLKLLRKLLELTDVKSGIGIISDTNRIYGIGSVKSGCFCHSVIFEDDHKWTLFDEENELLAMKNSSPVFVSNLMTKRDFVNYASRIFPEKADSEKDEISTMYNIIKALIKQKKGTILVIMKDAEKHIHKYQDLSMIIKPVPLDERNVEKLSSIDGAIIMDENCVCYGFGVVLDGLDTGTGNRARGSRYNSSERFFNLYKNEENTGLIVFILSDDGNYNFFPEM